MPDLSLEVFRTTLPKIKSFKKNWNKNIPINIQRFVQELETNEFAPLEYYHGFNN